MARGGKRQGTPGTAYSNRTDLATDYAGAASAMPAQAAPSAPQAAAAAPPGFPAVEDTPFLDDPDTSPSVTPGFGEGLVDPPGASRDLTVIKNYLPDMRQQAAYEDAPPTFKAFVRWLEQQ